MATEQSSGSDQELVERIQAGEEALFEVLLGRYQDRVYWLALSLTKNPADAEEVLQDVFLTVYRKTTSFERRSAFSTWLYRIAVNTALMKLQGQTPPPPPRKVDSWLIIYTARPTRAALNMAHFSIDTHVS